MTDAPTEPEASPSTAIVPMAPPRPETAPPSELQPRPALGPPEPLEPPDSTPRMTIGEHLVDLRKRIVYAGLGLLVAVVVTLVFGKQLLRWIELPYDTAMSAVGLKQPLIVMEITEAFSMYLKVSLYAAMVLSGPWILYQLWRFVAAGLYARERRYVQIAAPVSLVLFAAGAAFAVFLSVPAIEFFIRFGQDIGVQTLPTLGRYIDFIMYLLVIFGVIFQMPLVVLVLARVGLVNMKMLHRYRRHVIVAICAIAAVLAPPDVFSMIAMAMPMWVLYEIGLLAAWLLVFRKQKDGEPVTSDQEPVNSDE